MFPLGRAFLTKMITLLPAAPGDDRSSPCVFVKVWCRRITPKSQSTELKTGPGSHHTHRWMASSPHFVHSHRLRQLSTAFAFTAVQISHASLPPHTHMKTHAHTSVSLDTLAGHMFSSFKRCFIILSLKKRTLNNGLFGSLRI